MEENTDISQELLETIERYLKEEMSNNERTVFEKQMEENALLKQHVIDTELLFSGIKKAAFKSKLDVAHKNLVQKKSANTEETKVFKLNFKTLSIAASVAILIGSFWFLNEQSTNQKLFDQYFEADRGLATVMSETDNHAFEDAMVDYKNTKYDLAIKKWKVLLASKPKNDTLNYFLGVAELANKNELKAISYLKKVVNDEKSAFEKEAYYYLGLAYLKCEKTQAAIENLKKNNSPKSKKIILELTN